MKEPSIKVAILVILLAAIAAVLFYGSMGELNIGRMADSRTSQAEDALRKEIDSKSQGNIQLTDFKKIDGVATETFGVKGYNLQFEGQITFKSAGIWLAHDFGSTLAFTFSKAPVAFGQMNGATKVSAGASVKIAGTMEGLKSDNGWNFSMSECHIVSQ